MKKVLKTKEAAEILGIATLTLHRWERNGHIKSTRHPINNYRLFDYDDVIRLRDRILLK